MFNSIDRVTPGGHALGVKLYGLQVNGAQYSSSFYFSYSFFLLLLFLCKPISPINFHNSQLLVLTRLFKGGVLCSAVNIEFDGAAYGCHSHTAFGMYEAELKACSDWGVQVGLAV